MENVRLIDANILMKEIESLRITLGGKDIFTKEARDSVLNIINEQATAYDIDKKINELEKETEEYQQYDYPTNEYENGFENGCEYGFNKAIEIVKVGKTYDN